MRVADARGMLEPNSTVAFDEVVGLRVLDDRETAGAPPPDPMRRPWFEPAPLPIVPLPPPVPWALGAAPSMALWIEEPGRRPRRVTLPANHAVRVGRSSQTDVPVADLTVSRHHAVVWFDGRHATVVDNLSRRGLLVRGVPTSGEAALAPGVAVQIGGTKLLRAAPPHSDGSALSAVPGMGARAQSLAAVDLPLWIGGAPGCGQVAFAREVHRRSRRARRPLLVLPCASMRAALIPGQLFGTGRETRRDGAPAAGLLRCAQGGSILFEGVDDMEADAQEAMLRALRGWVLPAAGEARPPLLDVRLMIAGRPPSHAPHAAPSLGQRLFAGVRHAAFDAPPLGAMTHDFAGLAAAVLATSGDRRSFGPMATEVLRSYSWPGHLDELRDAVDFARSSARGERIEPGDLPRSVRGPAREVGRDEAALRRAQRDAAERNAIAMARAAAGNDTDAARLLGRSQAELYWDVARLGTPAPSHLATA